MALRATFAKLSQAKPQVSGLTSWLRGASGYRKYGLRREDLIMDELPGVQEALRRLPQEEVNARYFRIKRAMNASARQHYLPENEWTTTEEDSKEYLKPVLSQVLKEIEDSKKF